MFREVKHTGDLAIYVESNSLEGLFYDATIGMLWATNIDFSRKGKLYIENIAITSFDYESLLVDWLNEIIHKLNNQLFLLNCDIKLNDLILLNTCYFKKISNINCKIKSVTYHNLNIININELYKCTLVFDV